MSRPQLRSNQLITTFGPGAMVDLPDKSVIIAGLEGWQYEDPKACVVEEPRLSLKLARILKKMYPGYKGVSVELRRPPPSADLIFQKGQITPAVTGYIFPHWFIVQKLELSPEKFRRRRLVHRNELESNGRYRYNNKSQSVVPIRFVRACRKGHVGDIQWRHFVHEGPDLCQQDLWLEERGSTGDLRETWIVCDCGKRKSMGEATDEGVLGRCNGSRPWLDDFDDSCDAQNRLLIRTASNAYFSQILSVISIPNSMSRVEEVVVELWSSYLCKIETEEALHTVRGLVPDLQSKLEGLKDSDVFDQIQSIATGKESSALAKPVKEVEFDALSNAPKEEIADQPDGDFYVRQLATSAWSDPILDPMLEQVVLVHRLREVVALMGFTRFEPEATGIDGELDLNVERAKISRKTEWMPASENRGEGIFLRFNEDSILKWGQSAAVRERGERLGKAFDLWRVAHPAAADSEMPGLPYIMLHSLSHLLICAISMECGYPLSSIRERIFAPDREGGLEGCYGILLYTASSGAEGTLGGLVKAGRDIRRHLLRAMKLGMLCSNDPVCATRGSQQGAIDRVGGSACHGCLYISETSCERFNQYLDRSLVVPTIEQLGCEAFKAV